MERIDTDSCTAVAELCWSYAFIGEARHREVEVKVDLEADTPTVWSAHYLIDNTSHHSSQLSPRELHVALSGNECRMPRDLSSSLDQRSNELAMRWPVDGHALRSPIGLAFVNVEEAVAK